MLLLSKFSANFGLPGILNCFDITVIMNKSLETQFLFYKLFHLECNIFRHWVLINNWNEKVEFQWKFNDSLLHLSNNLLEKMKIFSYKFQLQKFVETKIVYKKKTLANV